MQEEKLRRKQKGLSTQITQAHSPDRHIVPIETDWVPRLRENVRQIIEKEHRDIEKVSSTGTATSTSASSESLLKHTPASNLPLHKEQPIQIGPEKVSPAPDVNETLVLSQVSVIKRVLIFRNLTKKHMTS